MAKIFLVRHAEYDGGGPDPSLSDYGKNQAKELGELINSIISDSAKCPIQIWSSSANRAHETAQQMKPELQLAEITVKDDLWSDVDHPHDFNWLKQEIESFGGEYLIIVSHLEYVRDFPRVLGFRSNSASYAEGVVIDTDANTCEELE